MRLRGHRSAEDIRKAGGRTAYVRKSEARSKKRVVKAWAVLGEESRLPLWSEKNSRKYGRALSYPYIFQSRAQALYQAYGDENYVIPCEIHFSLPAKSKK